MSQQDWATFDSQANKENIPFPHISHLKPGVISDVIPDVSTLASLSEKDVLLPEIEVDVVTVTQSSVPSPSLSQGSNISEHSQESILESPRVYGIPIASSRNSSDELDVESEDGEVTSRKEKSLGLLCQRFLIAMTEETRNTVSREVHLESVARKMNVEKRRIYDIVNVMEALDAMSKTNKSYYRWHGLEGLPKLMADLQREAVEERLPERVLRVEQAMCSFTELSQGNKKIGSKDIVGSLIGDDEASSSSLETHDSSYFPQTQDTLRKSRVDGRDKQGRNSLAQLCRRFLMVLLSNPKNTRRVSLDVASTVLIKDPETEGFEPPSRSRCRRLYDIANVLVALGLIKKVHYLFGTKKIPLFVYCGPEPDENLKFDVNACLEKLLSTTSTSQIPSLKTNTSSTHSFCLGKRSQSEASIHLAMSSVNKIPKIKSEDFVSVSSSSLMMFAELAAERLRIETENKIIASSIPSSVQCSPSGRRKLEFSEINRAALLSGNTLPKPHPQRTSFGGFSMSPLSSPMAGAKRYAVKVGNSYQMSALPLAGLQSIVLPSAPVWTPATVQLGNSNFSDLIRSPINSLNMVKNVGSSTAFTHSSTNKPITTSSPKTTNKHSVTNILGVSNKINTNQLNHRYSSPFQIVKKDSTTSPKLPLGSLHNIPGGFQ